MKYQVRVTKEGENDKTNCGTIFLQIFENLDVAELARFLNQPEPSQSNINSTADLDMRDHTLKPSQFGPFTTNEPSHQGMPEVSGVYPGGTAGEPRKYRNIGP